MVHYKRYKENSMKAIVFHRYGSPDVLELKEIDTPVARDDQVLVRVQAASVNPVDWHRMRGLPNFMRASEGLAKPKNPGLGADVTGWVEAVGGNVTQFQPGDEVFGKGGRSRERPDAIDRGRSSQPSAPERSLVIHDDRGLNSSLLAKLVVIDLDDLDGATVGKQDCVALAHGLRSPAHDPND